MSGDFDLTDGRGESAVEPAERRLVPMKVGSATVFVEATDDDATLETDEFHPVGALNPEQAFENASHALKECVRVVGQRIESMQDTMLPKEVGVEFTLTFDVEGKATIVPVLLTGKAKTAVGIKVTAKWQPGGQAP